MKATDVSISTWPPMPSADAGPQDERAERPVQRWCLSVDEDAVVGGNSELVRECPAGRCSEAVADAHEAVSLPRVDESGSPLRSSTISACRGDEHAALEEDVQVDFHDLFALLEADPHLFRAMAYEDLRSAAQAMVGMLEADMLGMSKRSSSAPRSARLLGCSASARLLPLTLEVLTDGSDASEAVGMSIDALCRAWR